MERRKPPGFGGGAAWGVAGGEESMARTAPGRRVPASKPPRIEEMERRRLRRTSRAAYGRSPKVPSTPAPEKGGQAIRALAPFGKLRPSRRIPAWLLFTKRNSSRSCPANPRAEEA